MIPPRRAFIHFLDDHVLGRNTPHLPSDRFLRDYLERLTRLTIISCIDHAFVPASSYFENTHATSVINRLSPLLGSGHLKIAANDHSIEEYLAKKQTQYSKAPNSYPRYFSRLTNQIIAIIAQGWSPRQRSSTKYIAASWRTAFLAGARSSFLYPSLDRAGIKVTGALEKTLLSLPDILGFSAFIPAFALELLPVGLGRNGGESALNDFITKAYIAGYLDDDSSWLISPSKLESSRFLPPSVIVSENQLSLYYRELGLLEFLYTCDPHLLAALHSTAEWSLTLEDLWPRLLAKRISLWSPAELASMRKRTLPSRTATALDDALHLILDYFALLPTPPSAPKEIIVIGPYFDSGGGAINISGDVVTIGGNQYNLGTMPPAKVLEAIPPVVEAAAEGSSPPEVIASLSDALGKRTDISAESVSKAILPAVQEIAKSPDRLARLKGLVGDLSVRAGGSLLATGILKAIELLSR